MTNNIKYRRCFERSFPLRPPFHLFVVVVQCPSYESNIANNHSSDKRIQLAKCVFSNGDTSSPCSLNLSFSRVWFLSFMHQWSTQNIIQSNVSAPSPSLSLPFLSALIRSLHFHFTSTCLHTSTHTHRHKHCQYTKDANRANREYCTDACIHWVYCHSNNWQPVSFSPICFIVNCFFVLYECHTSNFYLLLKYIK